MTEKNNRLDPRLPPRQAFGETGRGDDKERRCGNNRKEKTIFYKLEAGEGKDGYYPDNNNKNLKYDIFYLLGFFGFRHECMGFILTRIYKKSRREKG